MLKSETCFQLRSDFVAAFSFVCPLAPSAPGSAAWPRSEELGAPGRHPMLRFTYFILETHGVRLLLCEGGLNVW